MPQSKDPGTRSYVAQNVFDFSSAARSMSRSMDAFNGDCALPMATDTSATETTAGARNLYD